VDGLVENVSKTEFFTPVQMQHRLDDHSGHNHDHAHEHGNEHDQSNHNHGARMEVKKLGGPYENLPVPSVVDTRSEDAQKTGANVTPASDMIDVGKSVNVNSEVGAVRQKRQHYDHSHCYHDHCHDYYSDGHSHVRYGGYGGYGGWNRGWGRGYNRGYGRGWWGRRR